MIVELGIGSQSPIINPQSSIRNPQSAIPRLTPRAEGCFIQEKSAGMEDELLSPRFVRLRYSRTRTRTWPRSGMLARRRFQSSDPPCRWAGQS